MWCLKRHELHLLWHRSGDIENIAVQAREDPSVALSIAGCEGTSDAKTAAICSQDVGVRRVFAHRACCVRRALAHSLAAARADGPTYHHWDAKHHRSVIALQPRSLVRTHCMVPGEFVFLHAPQRHVGVGAIPVWTRVAGTVRTA